ncbi:type II secretion system major pseudopilin GspG [Acuticoccus sp.]|uniref:type II secretion system major pseudopilin GspG n=1 Tax=Acuticoccus sp. TaxID=1904378 RepID=UPI003B5252C7
MASSDRSRARRRDTRGGFTLVELLVVLVILGLVMGLVAPRVLGYLTSSRERAAALQITSLGAALDLYFLDVGRYPSEGEGLEALVERPSAADRWSGPYLRDGAVPLDPWGNAYDYTPDGGRYVLASMGPDGREGGGDDVAGQ